MLAESTWGQIARLIVGAFDVDIQHWMGNAFIRLRETDAGTSFAEWAEANRGAFETLLRVTSAAARQLPKDDNLLMETIYTQLGRLPVEVERAVKSGAPSFVSSTDQSAGTFYKKYEQAVQELSANELATVARLERQRLREWVNSPASVRPHLLAKWAERDTEQRDKVGRRLASANQSLDSITDGLKKWAAGRKAEYERLK